VALAAVPAALFPVQFGAGAVAAQETRVDVILSGLFNSRGLALGPDGSLWVAEYAP
jgi:hypothetical protein